MMSHVFRSNFLETSLLLVLFLGLAAYSCGIPIDRKRSLLLNMLYICDDVPNLVQLVPETKMAYVSIDKSFFKFNC